jgi:multiple sugar transport system ATP-binding protein
MAQVILKAVSKVYPRKNGTYLTAVNDLNLEIEDHEFVVLAGPAGCGKSSVIRMIAGLEAISKGDIFIGDRRINDVPPKDRDMVLVPDSYLPYPRMTVHDNLAFGLKQREFSEAEIEKRVATAAGILGLQELLEGKAVVLSAEQRQRVAVARAVALQPRVFLFDEPLLNLDAVARVQLRGEIAKLHQRLQAATIYATHDPVEAMALGGRIVVMNDGMVQQAGTGSTLYEEPANSFVAGFLGSPPMNLVRGTLKQNRDSLLFSEMEEGTIEARLPSSEFPGARDFIGKPVLLGIRPEDIQVAQPPKAPEKYSGTFPAIVDLVEPRGSETVIYLNTGSHKLFCSSILRMDSLESGHRLQFEMDLRKAHLFDPVSTRRIGPGNLISYAPETCVSFLLPFQSERG